LWFINTWLFNVLHLIVPVLVWRYCFLVWVCRLGCILTRWIWLYEHY
jgi:hypothetical protein